MLLGMVLLYAIGCFAGAVSSSCTAVVLLALTTSDAEEVLRPDWSAGVWGCVIYFTAMTPSTLHPPIMMLIATRSLLRLAMAFEVYGVLTMFPAHGPNAGVCVS